MSHFILLFILFCIGLGSFGGGYAMIPLLQHFLVETYLSQSQFDTLLALAQTLPGAFAVNMATYLGFSLLPHPLIGSVATTLALGLPSILTSLWVAKSYIKMKENELFQKILQTLKPTIAAFVLWAGFSILKGELTTFSVLTLQKIGLFCMLIALILTLLKQKPIFLILIGAGLALVANL